MLPPGFDHTTAAIRADLRRGRGRRYEDEQPRRGSWAMRIAAPSLAPSVSATGWPSLQDLPRRRRRSVPRRSSPATRRPQGKAARPRRQAVLAHRQQGSRPARRRGRCDAVDGSAPQASRKPTTTQRRRARCDARRRPRRRSRPPAAAVRAGRRPAPRISVSVPGLTVSMPSAAPPGAAAARAPPPSRRSRPKPSRRSRTPPPSRASRSSRRSHPGDRRAACREAAPAAPAAPKKQQVAAAAPTTTETAPASAGGANGYVVVLASVPASGSSRLDALKKFADMQQQYGTVLANKTPDVQRDEPGRQGRLPPPAGRPARLASQASELCSSSRLPATRTAGSPLLSSLIRARSTRAPCDAVGPI